MDTEQLIADLRRDEGCVLTPYRCPSGKLSIGIGRNLDDVGISDAEADTLLRTDIERVENGLDLHLPWWRRLDEPRQRVLANMAFNLGIAGLLKFGRTLNAIERGQYDEAASHMLASKWAGQVKGRAIRLANIMQAGK